MWDVVASGILFYISGMSVEGAKKKYCGWISLHENFHIMKRKMLC